MEAAGALELAMPMVQPAELWQESGRWEKYGPELLRIQDRHQRDFCLGPTHEEVITEIVRGEINSYKQLPLSLYQIQNKVRDEIRPRFGTMRAREFLMKDAYSFDLSEEAARISYQKMFAAYLNTFARMGITAIPMQADPGPIGGDLSHEFLILADSGESEVYCDKSVLDVPAPGADFDFNDLEALKSEMTKRTQFYAATDEKHDEAAFNALPAERQIKARGIEVGHIFYFGTKYSDPLKAEVQTKDGDLVTIHGGSYGIGVSRCVGAIIEASHDENGIIWPEGVTPYHAGIVNLKQGDTKADAACEALHASLTALGLEPPYDDRNERAGGKFATMDLIGLPWRITVGPPGLKNGVVELTSRKTGNSEEMPPEQAIARIAEIYGKASGA